MVALLSCTSSMATLLLAAVFPSNRGYFFTLSIFVAARVKLLGLVCSERGFVRFPSLLYGFNSELFFALGLDFRG